MPTVTETKNAAAEAPIVVDLGRKRRKQIKQLRKGTGKLLTMVNDCIEDLRTSGKISGAVRPVIVVVRQKSKRLSMLPKGVKLPGL